MKSIERAHMPKSLWERIKLPRNYAKALEIVDKYLVLVLFFYFSFDDQFLLPFDFIEVFSTLILYRNSGQNS